MIDLDNIVRLWHVSAPMRVVDELARMDSGELWYQKEAIKAHARKESRQSAFADSDYSIHEVLLKIISVIEFKRGMFWKPYAWILNLWGKIIFFLFGRKYTIHPQYGFLVLNVSDRNRPIPKAFEIVYRYFCYFFEKDSDKKMISFIIKSVLVVVIGILVTAFFWLRYPHWIPH